MGEKKSPEQERESLKQKEAKENSAGNLNDAFQRGSSGSLFDLVGSMSWKVTGLIILFLIIGFIVAAFLLN
ncbi:DUF6366 family protein [Halobacillus massiliensis]|uniref:DUF6366 family protein n=1 Tax=Halobacillus massiliensis TaxID=1926286 RepID=UPI0009E56A38|nr:DUF6366 family protein [Halobacillus massiliensis]